MKTVVSVRTTHVTDIPQIIELQNRLRERAPDGPAEEFLFYVREQVYARAAESRGSWDARLQALLDVGREVSRIQPPASLLERFAGGARERLF